jgi:muramoyltetrapeptide carboxypeptidase
MIIPPKLKQGDEIRIIAPARSLSLLLEKNIEGAKKNLEKQGFKVTFAKNCREKDLMISSSIHSRIEDIHSAFSDKNAKAIISAIGGFNSNQLLSHLNYTLIKQNPKIFCGYSDITALANAIYAKTKLVTYSGPHFSTWAMEKEFEYTVNYFKKCLMQQDEFYVKPSETWSDDHWYIHQNNRKPIPNDGFTILNKGVCTGTILGGNLCTFNLLQGTEFMPNISNSILFLEDDNEVKPVHFDRDLQSLIHQPHFKKVKGIVIGRFQKRSGMTLEKLRYIIQTKEELKHIPVIANANFGHTSPIFTFPIGGTATIKADTSVTISIIRH